MGYSSTAIAMFSLEAIVETLQSRDGDSGGSSNSWGISSDNARFYEIGRENPDGSITGTIMGPSPKGPQYSKAVGSFKITASGEIIRFPTATASERKAATEKAQEKMVEIYGG